MRVLGPRKQRPRGLYAHDFMSGSTILCLDDFTCGLADAAQVLRENGYAVLAADESSSALVHGGTQCR
jgi:hypothetical protein